MFKTTTLQAFPALADVDEVEAECDLLPEFTLDVSRIEGKRTHSSAMSHAFTMRTKLARKMFVFSHCCFLVNNRARTKFSFVKKKIGWR